MAANCLMTRRQASARLRAMLYEEPALRWLPTGASSWCEGGCLVLAQALHAAALGGEIVAVRNGNHGGAEHLVVALGHVYLDGDGISSEGQLLHRWRTVERLPAPFLGPYVALECFGSGIVGAGPADSRRFASQLLERGLAELVLPFA
jgi:hypothetical protein